MKKFYNLKPSFACRGSYHFKLPRHKLQSTLDMSNTDILNYPLYQRINIGHISYISSNFNSCHLKLLVPQSKLFWDQKIYFEVSVVLRLTLRYQEFFFILKGHNIYSYKTRVMITV